MNILVITGTQKFPFNRLIKAADELVKTYPDISGFAQIGTSTYIPSYLNYKEFLSKDEMNQKLRKADAILTHGGTGSIISALKISKPVVAVARLAKFEENVDDHQKEIVEEFKKDGMLIEAEDLSESALYKALTEAVKMPKITYQSNTDNVLNELRRIIESC